MMVFVREPQHAALCEGGPCACPRNHPRGTHSDALTDARRRAGIGVAAAWCRVNEPSSHRAARLRTCLGRLCPSLVKITGYIVHDFRTHIATSASGPPPRRPPLISARSRRFRPSGVARSRGSAAGRGDCGVPRTRATAESGGKANPGAGRKPEPVGSTGRVGARVGSGRVPRRLVESRWGTVLLVCGASCRASAECSRSPRGPSPHARPPAAAPLLWPCTPPRPAPPASLRPHSFDVHRDVCTSSPCAHTSPGQPLSNPWGGAHLAFVISSTSHVAPSYLPTRSKM